MNIVKKYKLISLKHSFPQKSYEYFCSWDMTTKEIIYTTEIDDAMNFINQSYEDIEYYLELISDKVWQGQYQICPDVALIELSAEIHSSERVYNNEDHIRMKAIKKLTGQEINLLGLEDLGVYYNMKVNHTPESINQNTFFNADRVPCMLPVEQLIKAVEEDTKHV